MGLGALKGSIVGFYRLLEGIYRGSIVGLGALKGSLKGVYEGSTVGFYSIGDSKTPHK